MKASLTAKIIIILCIVCLITGFITVDTDKSYYSSNKKGIHYIFESTNKVAVIELDGAIASSAESSFFSNEADASSMLKSLRAAKEDSDISGIILKINSPGGTVAMSQSIYNQIIDTRKNKPVISVLDDVAASGGYYIASASDRIIAQDGTLTGSIGVILSFMDYHNLLTNKLDISPVVIKSGKYKDIGSGSRQMTYEEKELMQNIFNDSYNQFLDAIRNGRVNREDNYSAYKTILTEDILKSNADGRVFTGRQAKQLGFVDETGDMDTAKEMISSMIQEKYNNKFNVKLIKYSKQSTFGEIFSGITEYRSNAAPKLTDFIPASMILNRKPLYLWE